MALFGSYSGMISDKGSPAELLKHSGQAGIADAHAGGARSPQSSPSRGGWTFPAARAAPARDHGDLRREEHALAEQGHARAAVHLTLEHLQLRHLALGLPVAPRLAQGGFDGSRIAA